MSDHQTSPPTGDPVRHLTLPPNCGADACGSVQETIMQALAAGQALKVDAGNVAAIGTPMMQLLAAAMRCFRSAGGSGMTIVDRSERFRDVARLLGLQPMLEGNGK